MDTFKLHPELLLYAYSQGYFPMPDAISGEIQWYRPDPRTILPLHGFHISHSLKARLKRNDFVVSFDRSFCEVMRCCAQRQDTWINSEFLRAYAELFELGWAHSVEVWMDDELVGGLYGVALKGAFFGESM